MSVDAWTVEDPTACPVCGRDSCIDHLPLTPQRQRLDALHATFRDWLSGGYDLDAIDAVLATAAAERLDGDPLWLLLISGSGNTKTETVCALAHLPRAIVTSTIASEGALLSGSAGRDKAKDATGGLLRRIGQSGVLVIKDATSILSMDRNTRASVLAAIREIHDGRWERNVGADGGRTLSWTGRIAIIGATTTAWDRAYDVIASMGDRFVVVRLNSSSERTIVGRQAIKNTGHESQMRAALAAAAADVVHDLDLDAAAAPTDAETTILLAAADVVTRCRTGVDYDMRGDVVDAHAPEMPTRLAKQLVQMLRGACAIGLSRRDALRLTLRCARDSMPPLRLAILEDVAVHPQSLLRDVRQRLNKPASTVKRQLQALHMLGVLDCNEVPLDDRRSSWYYELDASVNPTAVRKPEK